MIGLLGVSVPCGRTMGTVRLDTLPTVPAYSLSGIVARAPDDESLKGILAWCAEVFKRRATFAVGIVSPAGVCAPQLGAFTHPVAVVLPPEALEAESLPEDALKAVWNAAIEGMVFEELLRVKGEEILPAKATIEALIAHGVRGGTLASVARDLGCSPVTVWRRLVKIGVEPRYTLNWVRLRGYDLRVALGEGRREARRASGWYNRKAWEKAVARGRKNGTQNAIERIRGEG